MISGVVIGISADTEVFRGINVGSRQDFEDMNRLISATAMTFGHLVDRVFSFDQAEEAFAYLESQTHVGKVIIEMR